jgi:ESS family glutamate:Na+ symporter
MTQILNLGLAILLLLVFLALGEKLRVRVPWLQTLHIPASVVGGTLALLAGPGGIGAIATPIWGSNSLLAHGLYPESVHALWSPLPIIGITLVFATLFLGEPLPTLQDVWQKAAPQVAFSQSLAWGQYAVGLVLVLLLLKPWLGVNPLAATLIELAFEGGHGVTAGMAPLFQELGFAEASELGMGLATVGIISGVAIGTGLVAWGRKAGHIHVEAENLPRPQLQTPVHSGTDALNLQKMASSLVAVGLAVVLAWLILRGLQRLEALAWARTGFQVMTYMPLFPMAMLGSLGVQAFVHNSWLAKYVDRQQVEWMGAIALDVTVFAGLASMSLDVLSANWILFSAMAIAGIVWNVWGFVYLAPRLIPSYWFERGIADLGQSMGVTATGLLLLRMVDPHNRSQAFESFAYKQLLFEPLMGGGLCTALIPTLIVHFGPSRVLWIAMGFLVLWLSFGVVLAQRHRSTSATVLERSQA